MLRTLMPRPLQAIIFDMDGVLIDSERLWEQLGTTFCEKELNIAMPISRWHTLTGGRLEDVLHKVYAETPWSSKKTPEQIAQEMFEVMEAQLAQNGKAMPYAISCLYQLKRKGWPLALASSSPMRLINRVVDVLEIRDMFTVLHSAETEPYGKPHPAVYLTTAEKMGVQPVLCGAVEDSVNGTIAAKAAGMVCYAVPEAHNKTKPQYSIADFKLENLAELELPAFSVPQSPFGTAKGLRNHHQAAEHNLSPQGETA